MHATAMPDPGATTRRRSLALIIAGSLMLLAALLRANPWFGSANSAWPWEILLRNESPLQTANWALWLGAGLVAVVLGGWGTARWRGVLLGAATLVLLFTCYSGLAGLMIVAHNVPLLAGASLLMAGFLLHGSGRAQGAATALCATGALMALWALAVSFDYSAGEAPRSKLVVLAGDLVTRLTGGEVSVGWPNYDDTLASYAALFAACALGLLGLVGARGPLVGRIGLVAALLFFLVPIATGYGRALGNEGFDATTLSEHASALLIPSGFALAFLGAALLADLARAAEERT